MLCLSTNSVQVRLMNKSSKRYRFVASLVIPLACLFLSSPAFAQNVLWNADSGNWTDSNWTPSAPISTSNVFIDNGNPVASTVVLSIGATVNNLTLDSGDTLTLDPTGHLTVNGTASLNGTTNVGLGTLTLNGVSTNSGTMNLATEILILNGHPILVGEGVVDGAGSLTNTGTVQGSGVISVNITNTGTINATDLTTPIVLAGIVQNSGLIESTNGALTGGSGIVLTGTLNNFGTLSSSYGFGNANTGVLTNTGTVSLGSFLAVTNAGQITNAATGQMNIGDPFENMSGGTLNNVGALTASLILNHAGATVSNSGTFGTLNSLTEMVNAGTFKNSGTLTIEGFSNASTGVLTNTGTANLYSPGAAMNSGLITNQSSGQMNFQDFENLQGATLKNFGTVTAALIQNDADATVNNSGTFGTLNNLTALDNAGTFKNSGTLTTEGFTNASTGVLTSTGTANLDSAGEAMNSGLITNQSSGQMNFQDFENLQGGTLKNLGMMTAGIIQNDLGGSVNNAGSFRVLSVENAGAFNNSGTVTIVAGAGWTNAAGSSYVQTAGQTIVDGTMNSVPAVQIQGGVLSGTGMIVGGVLNSGGTVRPGDNGAPGTLVVEGYEQQSGATFDELISATANGTLVAVPGGITLDSGGLLDIDPLNGFTPFDGETFDIMAAIQISGTFANAPTTGFEMDGFEWTITYDPGEIVLDSVSPVSGGNGVPEPSALLLLAIGIFTVGIFSRRQQSANHCDRA